MYNYIFLASTFILIGYLMGRHHQWSLDDEIPILFFCEDVEENEGNSEEAIETNIIFFRGEWIKRKDITTTNGIAIPCDDGKNYMLFIGIYEIPEDVEVRVNTAKKHKLNDSLYVIKRVSLARKVDVK